MDRARQIYLIFNITILGWIVFFAVQPFLSPVVSNLFPGLWECSYFRLTGRPCPFCGISRDLRGIINGQVFQNGLTPLIVFFAVFELIFRFLCLFDRFLVSLDRKFKILLVFDCIVHLMLFLLFVSIVVWFLLGKDFYRS